VAEAFGEAAGFKAEVLGDSPEFGGTPDSGQVEPPVWRGAPHHERLEQITPPPHQGHANVQHGSLDAGCLQHATDHLLQRVVLRSSEPHRLADQAILIKRRYDASSQILDPQGLESCHPWIWDREYQRARLRQHHQPGREGIIGTIDDS
jgi:hypothetical protein